MWTRSKFAIRNDAWAIVLGGLFWLALTLLPTAAAHAEWPTLSCAFPHRIPVTITAGPTGHSTETRIDLVNADFPATYVFSTAGQDVRVFDVDDTTAIDYVVAGWDSTARSATIYVRTPTIAGGTSRSLNIYLGDNSLAAGDTATIVFPNVGMRLRSRVSTADPTSAADALAQYTAATIDVDDSVRTTITGLNNRAIGGTNGDYGWCVSAVLNVTPATTGVWEFRYGGDFGRGGHLFVRGQSLEEQWNDDLWWAGSYANTAETLEGAITLPVGWHRYEALGFEGCCDGTTGFQAKAPGGAWQDLSSTNFPLRAAQCIRPTATVSVGTADSCDTVLEAEKTFVIISDSLGNPAPYALPGSLVRYDLGLTNPGQIVDDGTIVLTDVLPPEIALMTMGPGVFALTDGTYPGGMTLTYGGPSDVSDGVEFSTDGLDFTYSPTAPTDPDVTHVRFKPTGAFNPNAAGNKPSISIAVFGVIE